MEDGVLRVGLQRFLGRELVDVEPTETPAVGLSHHRQLFHPSEYQDLDDWLQAGARTLRKRWTAVFDKAR